MRPEPASFDAFISYSRKDVRFATELERALERYTPPRAITAERRPIVVCRDQEDLAGPEYNEAIRRHLARSKKLVVICSPAARASEFVNDEIRRFAEIHGTGGIISILLSGVPNNAAGANDTDRLAFPAALCELLDMPLAISYVGYEPGRDRVNRGVFYGAWYTLLANLLDADRAAIEERDRRRKARVRNGWIGGTSTIVAVLSVLTAWALVERRTALRRGEVTLAQRLAAEARAPTTLDPTAIERRALAAVEAVRRLDSLGEPTYDAAAALRDATALLARRVLQLGPGHSTVAFSRDGLTAFAAQGTTVTAYTLRTGTRLTTLDAGDPVTSLVTNVDGRYVGAITTSGRMRAWVGPRWNPVTVPIVSDSNRVVCAGMSDDGRYVATLVADQRPRRPARLLVWRTDAARVVAETPLTAPSGSVVPPARDDCVQLGTNELLVRYRSADTSYVIAAALWRWRPTSEVDSMSFESLLPSRGSGTLREWLGLTRVTWVTDSAPLVLVDREGRSRTTPTGDRALAAASDSTTGSLSTERKLDGQPSGKELYIPLLTQWMVSGTLDIGVGPKPAAMNGIIQLTPDSSVMVTADGSRVRLWRTQDGQELLRITAPAPVTRLSLSPTAQHLATWDSAGAVAVWDVAHPSERLRVPRGRVASASDDGRRIVAGTSLGISISTQDAGIPFVSVPLAGGAGLVAVSPDGRYVVAAAGDPSGIVFFRDRLRTLVLDLARGVDTVLSTGLATAAEFSPDGRSLVLGTADSAVRFISLGDRRTQWQKRFDGGQATRIVLSADGRVIALAIEPQFRSTAAAIVVSTQTGSVLRRVDKRSSNAVALSADGSQLASATDTSLDIVRVGDGAVIARLPHPPSLDVVRHVAFLPDGQRIMAVAGSVVSGFFGRPVFSEQAVSLWDLRTGRLEWRLPSGADGVAPGVKEQPFLADVAWTSNGREVAAVVLESREDYWGRPSSLARADVRVWRLDGRAPEEVFRTNADGMARIVGLNGNAGLVFTAQNGLRAWSYRTSELVAEACRRITRSLTAAEWNTLIGTGQPRPTCAARQP